MAKRTATATATVTPPAGTVLLSANEFNQHATPLPLGDTGACFEPVVFSTGRPGYRLVGEVTVTINGQQYVGYTKSFISIIKPKT